MEDDLSHNDLLTSTFGFWPTSRPLLTDSNIHEQILKVEVEGDSSNTFKLFELVLEELKRQIVPGRNYFDVVEY
jgi:hypothetical protein